MSLRSKRSAHNPQVTLITSDPTSSSSVKTEPTSPSSTSTKAESPHFTSLRRSTRSLATTLHSPASTAEAPISPARVKPDLSKYAFNTPAPSRAKRPKLEHPSPSPLDTKGSPTTTTTTPRSSSKKASHLAPLEKAHAAPPRWQEQYRLIQRMRAGISAPVDTMGCERPSSYLDISPKTRRFHTLISLMLSSQTKDAVTAQAVTNLHLALPGGLTAESLAAAEEGVVQEAINKVGFWRRKTVYIQEAAKRLLEREGEERGDVPRTIEELCELKGVGPKMGFLALQCAWDINAGIGVDVHVHRITNRLRWHKPPTQTPEQTRINLESWLPAEYHKPINPMMVGFGQVICLPVGPRCDICLLGQQRICPSRIAKVNAEGRKAVIYTFTAEDGEEKDLVKMKIDAGEEEGGIGLGTKVQIGYEDDGGQGLVGLEPEVDREARVAEEGAVLVKSEGDDGR